MSYEDKKDLAKFLGLVVLGVLGFPWLIVGIEFLMLSMHPYYQFVLGLV